MKTKRPRIRTRAGAPGTPTDYGPLFTPEALAAAERRFIRNLPPPWTEAQLADARRRWEQHLTHPDK